MAGIDKINSEKDAGEFSGFRGEVRIGEEMCQHTTFRIGGPVEYFFVPVDMEDLIYILEELHKRKIACHVLGRGSNLLVSDRGVDGAVVQVDSNLCRLSFDGKRMIVEAGFSLARLSRLTARRGLSGLEFGGGIPGTMGGAVMMNAGCGGEEISRVIRRVRTFKSGSGVRDWAAAECRFAYRASRFLGSAETILEIECELSKDAPFRIRAKSQDLLSRRKKSLPLEYPSAGSIFKNPSGDHAGRLIERAGLKGVRIGGAEISEKHANIIINRGEATASDVKELIFLARKEVERKFAVRLELELEIWD